MEINPPIMTEDQKKKYEEAAKEYAIKEYTEADEPTPEGLKSVRNLCARYILTGCEHAHPIAHSEGWNQALDACAKIVWGYRHLEKNHVAEINDELQKLRK